MASYVQAGRPITVTTPLGPDDLLLMGLSGRESISQLFSFQLELLASKETEIAFDKLLGQNMIVTLRLPGENKHRYFNGICSRLWQSGRNEFFTGFRAEIVPGFWLLTRRLQSRIFQHLSVPDILKEVLQGLDVSFQMQGTYHPRDYCVQYGETDFSFASRLMEEEGIHYFFKHTDKAHQMIVADTPQSHLDLPEYSSIRFEETAGGLVEEDRILSWEKMQQLRSGKYTLYDQCFELPDKHLEAETTTIDKVAIGKVDHKFRVGGNDKLEIYEYPGLYAQRFDGVNPSGGPQGSELNKIFEDNKRTVKIRMQQEEFHSLSISGTSNCGQMTSGHKFTLKGHYDGDGPYLVTGVYHQADLGSYRSGMEDFKYSNHFTCIPFHMPFRPSRVTPRPLIHGTQTAIVVGPAGDEIFTDQYGRVKVQFHWDRQGKGDQGSSCWIRVATPISGRSWGTMYLPRIGQEVVVAFEDGDPDRPIIVGSVYNASDMPAYKLPEHKTKTGYKSYSSPGGEGFNELRFEDKKGHEQIFVHGQCDLDVRVRHDRREWIGRDRHLVVKRDKRERISRDAHTIVERDVAQQVNRDLFLKVGGKQAVKIDGSCSLQIDGNVGQKFGKNHYESAGEDIYLKAGKNLVLEAGVQVSLKVGGNFVDIGPSGVAINGTTVLINSGGAPAQGTPGSIVPPPDPDVAEIADNANPGSPAPSYKSQRAALSPLELIALEARTHSPASGENPDKRHWIEIELVDKKGNPIPGEPYQITLPDGKTLTAGILDEKGYARVDGVDPGNCKVTFPRLDKRSWNKK